MRAAYLVAPGILEMRDDPVPLPEPGGVVVRVRAALTDGTDLKAYRRGHPQMPMPTRFGHEFSGDVAATGAGTEAFAVGDAIVCVHSAPCGACFWCAHEQEELCEHVMDTKILGAYADYIAVPAHIVARNAFRKPPGLSYTAAAFLEPLSCVVHAQDVLAPRAGSRLLVIGDGGFGLLHALVARARGGCDVLLAGRNPQRLALAASLGVDRTILTRGPDDPALLDAVRAATEGRGADAAIECTGALAVWEAAPRFVRRGGTVVLFGGLPGGTRASFDAARLHYDEVRVLSPFHFTPRAVRAAFDLLARGAIDPLPLVAGTYPLAAVAAAFAALDGGAGIKYEIVP
jgi:L-iditol 2-dehydrogenase